MSLWYTPSNQNASTGKPRHLRRLGTQKAGDQQYRECSIKLITYTTGSSVKRNSYQAAVSDSSGRSVAYLRGYASPEQATKAAHEWIDRHFAKLAKHALPIDLGKIPKLPPEAPQSQALQ